MDPQKLNSNSENSKIKAAYQDLPLPPSPQATPIPPAPNRPASASRIPDIPLSATKIETPQPKNSTLLRDLLGLSAFVAIVIIGAFLINIFIFRSFNVVGPSMEPTLQGGENDEPNDRLIVNRTAITFANFTGKNYIPNRGQIIVFKNPHWVKGEDDEFIVKRVIGLPGERVAVADCVLKVYNSENPNGFNPYENFNNLAKNDSEINACVDGDGTNATVPEDEIFVVGDHRAGSYSMDSRNGGNRVNMTLGTIPLDDIIGPVVLRIWPLNNLQIF